jgi:hypothetical protein
VQGCWKLFDAAAEVQVDAGAGAVLCSGQARELVREDPLIPAAAASEGQAAGVLAVKADV